MKPGLHPGVVGALARHVGAELCIHLGSDHPRGAVVFSTPAMIDLMEHAAREALRPWLEPGEESVGVVVHVEHMAATPLGVAVEAEAVVSKVEGRLVDFDVTARDGRDVIGRGTHRRAVIAIDRFAASLDKKTAALPEIVGMTGAMETSDSSANKPPRLETITIGVDGPTATITLDRPTKLNAVNVRMTDDWERTNAWLATRPDIRVAIVRGAGEAFCAGDDVPEVGTLALETARQLSHRQARLYLRWERLPQVFVASVRGPAFGAGCVAAYSCDFRIAELGARFAMPEIKLGWPPGYGLAQLTALVGKAKALELCLLGEAIDARTAHAIGLVHEVVPGNRLEQATRDLAQRLLAMPAAALRETKRLIHLDEGLAPKGAYLGDTDAYVRCLAMDDAKEGIAAFREKRPPRFKGT